MQTALSELQSVLEQQEKALAAQVKAEEDAKRGEANAKSALEAQKEAEEAVKKAEEEQRNAVDELKNQEDAYNTQVSTLDAKSKDEKSSMVQRNKAAAELAQLKQEDPLPLRKAKISSEAALRKVEKERKAAEVCHICNREWIEWK